MRKVNLVVADFDPRAPRLTLWANSEPPPVGGFCAASPFSRKRRLDLETFPREAAGWFDTPPRFLPTGPGYVRFDGLGFAPNSPFSPPIHSGP